MGVALIMDFPGESIAKYHEVMEQMDLGGVLPPGALLHTAGSYGDGLRVVDIWEDAGAADKFTAERILPTIAAAGVAPPSVLSVEFASRIEGSSAAPALVHVATLRGVDEASIAEIMRRAIGDGGPPRGIVLSVNGRVGDDWVVVGAWASRADRDRFIDEKVRPAADALGVPEPPVEDLDVEASLTQRSLTAA
jgi:hypothetical protein